MLPNPECPIMVSETSQSKSYRQEEVQQILQLAIARQTDQEELTREQLWEIAEEMEIPQDCLQAAEQEWLSLQTLQHKHQAFDLYRWNQFKHRAGRYLIINIFFISLDLLISPALSWSLYILLILGLKLALHGWKLFQGKGETYEEEFRRWERKTQVKQFWTTVWDKLQGFINSSSSG